MLIKEVLDLLYQRNNGEWALRVGSMYLSADALLEIANHVEHLNTETNKDNYNAQEPTDE